VSVVRVNTPRHQDQKTREQKEVEGKDNLPFFDMRLFNLIVVFFLCVSFVTPTYFVIDNLINNEITVLPVENKVVVGKMAGNRELEFGVQNILEELVSERGLDLTHNSDMQLKVQIIYFDVLKTQSNLSVFHSDKESVVIRMKGEIIKNGKVLKKVIAEESADEVSMSTLLVDTGGKFNQNSLSTALKKTCNTLINKLL
jgi:hypothetical protein